MGISAAMGNAIVPESYGFRNKIINGNFMINQRGYASGANLASGSYGFDRWKSNYTNTTLTFTSAPQGQLVTISASGVIRQIVERANVQPGSYVLSWKGTATGRVYNDGASAPSYATGPLSVYLDGTANVIVEFTPASGTATLGDVQLELGSRATPFEFRPVSIELQLCQRYFYRFTGNSSNYNQITNAGPASSSGIARAMFIMPVPMRRSITTTDISFAANSLVTYNGAALPVITSMTVWSNTNQYISADWVSSSTTVPAVVLTNNGVTSGMSVNAEL